MPSVAELVKDINLDTAGSSPANILEINGTAFFTSDDGAHGRELWKSDGTVHGTVLVKDTCPGEGGAFGESGTYTLRAAGDTLFFIADDGTHGRELWASDGTIDGTVMLKDITPAAFGSGLSDPFFANLTVVGDTLFFVANDGTTGLELWKSDGTPDGTVMLKDIRPGNTGSVPTHLMRVGDTLFFGADDGTNGRELWKSDGTPDGTIMLKDIRSGNASGYSQGYWSTVVGDALFFVAEEGANGTELWRSDGTADGTALVKNIGPGNDEDGLGRGGARAT